MPLTANDVDRFEASRPRLEAIAYRLLGSAGDAEDAVQDTFLRWQAADVDRIEVPEAWLTKVLTNLCLNQLTSARARRETYVGQWLPEPLLAGDPMLGPADTAEQRESVSFAVLTLMERLSPNERAVYVLREAFDYPHREIAEILDITEAASQQIFHRAKKHVADGKARTEIDEAAARRIVEEFLAAATSGQTEPLVRLLTDDADRDRRRRREDPGPRQGVRGRRRGREVPAGPVQARRGQARHRRRLARGLRLDRQRRPRRRGGRRRPGRRRHVPGGHRRGHRRVPQPGQPRQARTRDRAVGGLRPRGTPARRLLTPCEVLHIALLSGIGGAVRFRWRTRTETGARNMKHRIVVLGAGYAGAIAAGRLAKRLHREDVAITLVNAEPDFVERVRMHQLAIGQDLKPRPLQRDVRGHRRRS